MRRWLRLISTVGILAALFAVTLACAGSALAYEPGHDGHGMGQPTAPVHNPDPIHHDQTSGGGALMPVHHDEPGMGPIHEDASHHYYQETNHYLSNGFLGFWNHSGGMPVFGYPLTEEINRLSSDVGHDIPMQYLERQRFEYHQELQGTPYEISLGRMGVEALQAQHRNWESAPKADPLQANYCPSTGHAIDPLFNNYWRNHGLELGDRGISYRESVALFGYPVAEPQMERNSSGEMVLTQWFERARFEYHPNNPAGSQVQLGRLGAEMMNQ
jgi:hypothetical protein